MIMPDKYHGLVTLDDQRPSWDLVTVYFAVEGAGPYLESAGESWLEIDA